MGLDASNARLQTLVARLSDIHFRGQQINNTRLLIASREEQMSEDYSASLSKTKYVLTDATGASTDLTNSSWSSSFQTIANTVICDNNGTPINGNMPWSLILTGLKDGKYQTYTIGDSKASFNSSGDFVDGNNQPIQTVPASYTQYNWSGTLPDGNTSPIQSTTDTDGQEEAQMKYDAELGTLQPEDKALEMQLKDLDTQAQAIQTEVDAVKKVIDKDIEMTFKTFGNG